MFCALLEILTCAAGDRSEELKRAYYSVISFLGELPCHSRPILSFIYFAEVGVKPTAFIMQYISPHCL